MSHVLDETASTLMRSVLKPARIRDISIQQSSEGVLFDLLYSIYDAPPESSLYSALISIDELEIIMQRQGGSRFSSLVGNMCLVYIDESDRIWYAGGV